MKEGDSQAASLSREQGDKRYYNAKKYFINQLLKKHAIPMNKEWQSAIGNMVALSSNENDFMENERGAYQQIKNFLASNTPLDPFDLQKYAGGFKEILLKNTNPLDMIDLLLAVRVSRNALASPLEEVYTKSRKISISQRFHDLSYSVLKEFAHAVPPMNLRGEEGFNLLGNYEELFFKGETVEDDKKIDLVKLQLMIRDRIVIPELIWRGGLYTKGNNYGENPYSKPIAQTVLDQLNEKAADTLERLHLLKFYGITPFDISASITKLPWDIAVVPPLDNAKDGVYAEGAVADFMLMTHDPNRSSILFEYKKDANMENITNVIVGDADILMRFRLHDNGQISHGSENRNIPSDITENTFRESYAAPAFDRMRRLFINLAYDALVPEDVVASKEVGSVAKTFTDRSNESVDKVLGDLILRRRRSLQRAEVTEKQRIPKGWKNPKSEGPPNVGGYTSRLPEGTTRRATAEDEAREYYKSINVRFDGLPEGHTFTRPYHRKGQIQYKRARFRKSSETAKFLKDI